MGADMQLTSEQQARQQEAVDTFTRAMCALEQAMSKLMPIIVRLFDVLWAWFRTLAYSWQARRRIARRVSRAHSSTP